MIRLLIVDDHTLMREGLKQLFALVDDIEVVGEADHGTQALDRLREGGIDLVLLDLTMPGIGGADLVARIRSHHPDLRILVLSMHNEPLVVQRVLKAGANGYMTKDGDPDSLLSAIRKVAAGGRYLDAAVAEKMAFGSAGLDGHPGHDCLTDRELQIMTLLASGLGVNDIAEELAISNKTVSTHKARLMEKMGFASNADLVRYALENGISS